MLSNHFDVFYETPTRHTIDSSSPDWSLVVTLITLIARRPFFWLDFGLGLKLAGHNISISHFPFPIALYCIFKLLFSNATVVVIYREYDYVCDDFSERWNILY